VTRLDTHADAPTTVAMHLDAEDAEARLLAVKGHALHAAREVFEECVGCGM
jgi:hypothetical protein